MADQSFYILANQAHLPIIEIDKNGIITYINGYFCDVLGYTKKLVAGEHFQKFIQSDLLEKYMSGVADGAIGKAIDFSVQLICHTHIKTAKLSIWLSQAGDGDLCLQGSLLKDNSPNNEQRSQHTKTLQGLEYLLMNQSGMPVFNTLAIGLLNMLGADIVLIGELDAENEAIHHISMASQLGIATLNSYKLAGTPCARVVDNATACKYPSNVYKIFPDDEILFQLKAQGYVGIPLMNSQRQVIGIMLALYKDELQTPELAISILEMLAHIVAAEMERFRTASTDLSKYKTLIGSMTEGVVFFSSSGTVMTHNLAAERLLGLSAQQLRQSSVFDNSWPTAQEDHNPFNPEEYPPLVTFQTKKPCHHVIIGRQKPSGEKIWLNTNTEPMWSDDGQFIGVVATFFDMTELKQAEEKLVKSEESFRYLFESMNDAIVILEKSGKIILANNATYACFGHPPKDLIGQKFTMLIPSNQRRKQEQVLGLFFQLSDVRNYVIGNDQEIMGLKANGMEIPIEINLTHIVIDHKSHVICSIRDMSHNKRYLQLETAYKKITDSVQYAKRIQMALLGGHSNLLEAFKDAFIFFSPKDVVSGDFYWFEEIQRLHIVAGTPTTQRLKILIVSDCTGHGVPGAFMAALGNAFIHEIVNEHHIVEPHHILMALNTKITNTLQKQDGVALRDGMDMGIIVWDEQKKQIYFAGARHSLYMLRDGELNYIRGDGHSLGGKMRTDAEHNYSKQTIATKSGDRFYLSTDGFQDQFGGPEGKKYMRSKFRQLLVDLWGIPMNQQTAIFKDELETWQGNKESQTDDVLVVGVEI